ncbi:MAG: adenylosuccinate lyase [Spirochaetaceae bacterium]|jgi:adenylosuccinate lyase|nr:adenylosuccinate lyase [Spirochaetaceae bacterium]
METRTIFRNISPLDHRYSVSDPDRELFDALAPLLSEEAAVASCVKAEIALIKAHLWARGGLSAELKDALEHSAALVDPEEVYQEEAKTRHNIRALVQVLKKKVPPETAHLVHLGATSADILDTAHSFRIREVTRKAALPLLRKLEILLCGRAEQEADTAQAGRTHGQHAVPITAGFAFAEYVSRLGASILEIDRLSGTLKGKLSGAVGAYNATSMLVRDPEGLERRYLAEMGLEPADHATQIVEPEYLLRLLLEYNVAFGIIANLADDLRHLQRSEIAEVSEGFGEEQVGSSTMPQKRNPWNAEHIKSLWKAFMPRVTTFFMDQISEHQRDLSNSASQRFIAEYITGFCLAANRMAGVIQGLRVDRERLLANLRGSAGIPGGVMAECAYILLAETGVSDAHEVIRRITLAAEKENTGFAGALAKETAAFERIQEKLAGLGIIQSPDEALAFFQSPERYRGLSAEKARSVAQKYRKLMAGHTEEGHGVS